MEERKKGLSTTGSLDGSTDAISQGTGAKGSYPAMDPDGHGRLRDHGGDDYLRRGLNHERETKKNEVAQGCHPLAQAVLLASPDPLAEETEGAPGWQTCLANDATRLRWHVRPALREAEPVDGLPLGSRQTWAPKRWIIRWLSLQRKPGYRGIFPF